MSDTVSLLWRPAACAQEKAFRADLLARKLPMPGRHELSDPTSAKKFEATCRREQLRKEAAQYEFSEPYWRVETTLSWIAWRVVERVLDDWRPATWYNGSPRPQNLLLSALKKGELEAFDRNGSHLPQKRWAFVNEHDLADEIVRLDRAKVIALWPSPDGADKKRLQGRPSKCGLYVAEHDRRCAAGEAKHTLVEEVAHLLSWFSRSHPDKIGQAAKAGTIKNQIRQRHAEYVLAATK